MKQKISQIFRSTFGFGLVGFFLFIALLMHLWLLFSNYNGVVQSFEMLNYDQRPLSENRLFGWMFEAFLLGEATLCELYAGAVVFAMGFSLMVVCYFVTQLIMQIRDRAIFLRTGDGDSARNIELSIYYTTLPWLILWVPLAAIITVWDIKMFGYRAVAGIMGYDGPETAMSLENFGTLIAEYGDKFSMEVTSFSAWGYTAAIIITSLLLEFMMMKFKERWETWLDAFAGLFTWEELNTQQVALQPQVGSTVGNIPVVQNQNSEGTFKDEDASVPLGDVSKEQSDGSENESEDTSINIQEDTDDLAAIQQTGFDMDEDVEVIGGNGSNIKRSEALEDRVRYYMDGEGKVWDRSYYNNLHGEDSVEILDEREEAA